VAGERTRGEGEAPGGPAVSGPAGYVVLTEWPDTAAGWRDDWDGEVHATRESGDAALRDAASALGWHSVALAELRIIEGDT
jgi:hypothetical protein